MTPLHEVDALLALAEGTGPAADWARARLVFLAPEAPTALPDAHAPLTPWLVAAPGGIDLVLGALVERRELAAVGLLEALELGLLPEDTAPVAEAVQAALLGDGSPEDLHLATLLARLGPVDTTVLAAAARSESPDRDWLLPSVALRAAEKLGKVGDVAEEVAGALLGAERQRPGAIALCFAELGVPTRSTWDVPHESVRDAAAVLGVPAPALSPARGSKKRHAQQAVRELLDGRDDAGSALLRALASRDADLARRLVYSAAWLAAFEPTDAVADAVYRHGGLDSVRLSAARRDLGEEHKPILAGALDHGLEKAAILAHHLPGHPLANEVLDYLVRHDMAHRIDLFLGVRAAWGAPERVPQLLGNQATLALGLVIAEWMPTLEVLQALLSVTLPEGTEWTHAYAKALAAMGDPAAADVLRSLVQEEPEATAEARLLAESILHQPLV
ncbi:MAG: hypothetical protein EP330_29305 [Deltaproteobacteria bacterium]|nr:MAG: hypothetical protein EP330_29305 [Deltaproteobacteria bacterium]